MMQNRIRILFSVYLVLTVLVLGRLFYWQIVVASSLEQAASLQHTEETTISPERGEIITRDGFPLVFNEQRYNLNAYVPNLSSSGVALVDQLLPHMTFEIEDPVLATDSARAPQEIERLKAETRTALLERLNTRTWTPLAKNLSVEQKEAIESLGISGITFDEYFVRHYPEASMSAHTLGFVGRNEIGEPTGYFGLEGYYDRELTGASGLVKQEKDALGRPLLTGSFREVIGRDGRDLTLNLIRGVEFIAEEELNNALEKYGASSGEVVIMDPRTGSVLALASLPAYDPAKYWKYETQLYKNPTIANTYEPGSTFKVLVMAAALNENAIDIKDTCDICDGPLEIDKYTIKTWDGKYVAGRTPEDIIVHSDNIGMVWTARKLTGEKLVDYIKKFGFGEKTGIDLQEEVSAPLRKKWGEIDYATASFGQGIAVTSIQMLRAVGAIANGGKLVTPRIVAQVSGEETIELSPTATSQVISEETAKKITEMMVKAVEQGEAKWTRIKGYKIAGKTGTAQIPVAGHYDSDKTIASFVGYAPADDPRFVMLVKLREPTSSPWGSETAAPLWFDIARRLFVALNIPQDGN